MQEMRSLGGVIGVKGLGESEESFSTMVPNFFRHLQMSVNAS